MFDGREVREAELEYPRPKKSESGAAGAAAAPEEPREMGSASGEVAMQLRSVGNTGTGLGSDRSSFPARSLG